ncbi:MAG: hypothetical protein WBB58_03310, partial [Microgenomates group bacterium]
MNTLPTKATMSSSKTDRPKEATMPTHITRLTPARLVRLIVPALLLGVALLLALPAQPAAASCGGTTTVGTETELN